MLYYAECFFYLDILICWIYIRLYIILYELYSSGKYSKYNVSIVAENSAGNGTIAHETAITREESMYLT